MEAFLATHSHLELPTGCQGDGQRDGLSKAGWKDVYFIQKDGVTCRNEAEPQKSRVNSSNQVYTMGDTAEHFQKRDMVLKQVIIRKWPRLPEPEIIPFFLSLYWICYKIASVLGFGFFSCKGMWDLHCLNQGLNPQPLQWKHRIWTTGSSGKYCKNSEHLNEEAGFPGGSDGKESACNVGDLGSIPGSGRSPHGGRHSNPVQDSCLENPMDRGAWRATVHGVAKSQTGLNG